MAKDLKKTDAPTPPYAPDLDTDTSPGKAIPTTAPADAAANTAGGSPGGGGSGSGGGGGGGGGG